MSTWRFFKDFESHFPYRLMQFCCPKNSKVKKIVLKIVITYTNINHAAMLAYLLVESTSIPFFKGIKLPSPQAHVYSFQIALKISWLQVFITPD